MKRILQLATLFAVSALSASAAITVTLDVLSPVDLGGGVYEWIWEADLNAGSRVQDTTSGVDDSEADGFFTIYDVGGISALAILDQPADWIGSVVLVGTNPQTPLPQNPPDSNAVYNITWTYVGDTPITTPGSLGFFSVQSSVNYSTTGFYTYRDLLHNPDELNDGDPQSGAATTAVPGDRPGEVPEPATMGLMGSALAGLAFFARRK